MTQLLLTLALAAGLTLGQAAPAFEVASIRPSSDQVTQVNVGVRVSNSQVRLTFLSLRDYVAMAYRVRPHQITGPGWLAQSRFDIAAKIPDGGTAEQMPEMLQALLVERFQAKVHREAREFPVYALVVGREGLKMREITPGPDDAPAPGASVNVAASGSAAGVGVDLGNGSSFSMSNGRIEASRVTMAALADMLTRFLDRPVVDQTGLTARYDLAFPITPEDYTAMMIRAALYAGVNLPPQALRALDNASGDPLSGPLRDAGLTLQSIRAPLEVLVVDSMLRTPTPD
ncbi:MAG: TIGR03435 family protein [Vicinamibacterales bacterium]